jgi:HEAT repeat protein
LKEKAVEGWIAVLGTSDVDLQVSAMEALGKSKDRRAVVPLIELLRNEEEFGNVTIGEIARFALWELIRDDVIVLDELRSVGNHSSNEHTRAQSMRMIADIIDSDEIDDEFRSMVVNGLKDQFAPIRAQAAYSARKLRFDDLASEVYINLVQMLLNDHSTEVRANAAYTLGSVEFSPSFDALLVALNSTTSDTNLRVQIIRSLGEFGDTRAVPSIIQYLDDGDKEVREAAIRALGKLDDPTGHHAILNCLAHAYKWTRIYSIEVLGKRKVKQAIEPLLQLLNDPEDDVVVAAAKALGQICEAQCAIPMVQAALDLLQKKSNKRSASKARSILESIAEIATRHRLDVEVMEFLITMMADKEISAQSSNIMKIIESVGSARVTILIDALAYAQGDLLLQKIIGTLGRVGDKRAVPALIPYLQHTNVYVRNVSCSALCNLADPRAIQPIVDMLQRNTYKDEVYWDEVNEQWFLLADFGAKGVPMLTAGLSTSVPQVKRIILKSLWKINDPRAQRDCLACLNDSDRFVRSYSIDCLQRIKAYSAVPQLLPLLGDPEEIVRKSAAKALGSMGSSALPVLLEALGDNKRHMRMGASLALAKIGADAMPSLKKALTDHNPRVRRQARMAIAWMGDRAPIEEDQG